jgi:hypothetical protein
MRRSVRLSRSRGRQHQGVAQAHGIRIPGQHDVVARDHVGLGTLGELLAETLVQGHQICRHHAKVKREYAKLDDGQADQDRAESQQGVLDAISPCQVTDLVSVSY